MSAPAAPRQRGCFVALALACGLLGGLLAAELLLRAAGYRYGIPYLERDLRYGWRHVRNSVSVVDGIAIRINSHGFRGPEFPAQKPAGTRRFIALGCSCTEAGNVGDTETYAARWERLLNAAATDGMRHEVLNAGVGGYSTEMGKRWLTGEVLALHPDLVTIYFGWNDHWLARAGGNDRALAASRLERAKIYLLKSKLAQLAYQFAATPAGVALRGAWQRFRRGAADAPAASPAARAAVATGPDRDVSRHYRVPLSHYRENLDEMIDACRQAGAQVMLVTAPMLFTLTDTHRHHTAATAPLCDGTDTDAIAITHHLYAETTRAVGRERGVPVVDAAELFNRLPEARRATLFTDFVHPNGNGAALIAAELHRVYTDSFILHPRPQP